MTKTHFHEQIFSGAGVPARHNASEEGGEARGGRGRPPHY